MQALLTLVLALVLALVPIRPVKPHPTSITPL